MVQFQVNINIFNRKEAYTSIKKELLLCEYCEGIISAKDHLSFLFNIENISHTEEVNTKNGKTVKVCEKGFLPYEIKTLLQNSGFKVLNIWGGSAGSWNKEELKLDEMEIMVLSEKI